jgi:proteasome lid subunit RPN8/RPN11
MTPSTLTFPGVLYELVKAHLFPGDGLESAAILLCAKTPEPRLRLLVREIIRIPDEECEVREKDSIYWPGAYLEKAIDLAEADDLTIVLIHSHPGGLYAFSGADDASDRAVIPSLFQALGELHGTAIMTPDGAVRARLYDSNLDRRSVGLVSVAGHDLLFWWDSDARLGQKTRRPIAFTSGMTAELNRLSAALIGVSGTGSISGEQIARMGFGHISSIDFDIVELRNLNRILNSRLKDAESHRLKVEMFAEAVAGYRGEGVAFPVPASILTREAVLAASQCDVIFCCVDTLEARQIADLISSAFLIPMFDVGVVIPTRKTNEGEGVAIADVCGRIDYVQPGRSTLQDRGVYSPETLRAEYLRAAAPDAHRQELEAGYIKGLMEQAPSVITLNMRAASACVSEFIARAYPFRLEPNHRYARTRFSLAACEEEYDAEADFTAAANPILGRGAKEPLLGLPILGPPKGCKK